MLDPASLREQMDGIKVISHLLKLKFRLGNNLRFQEDKKRAILYFTRANVKRFILFILILPPVLISRFWSIREKREN